MKFADVTASSPNRQKKCPRGNQISPVEMLLQVFPYVVGVGAKLERRPSYDTDGGFVIAVD
jgi:hypothetical protein